jgi:hypothetical protein
MSETKDKLVSLEQEISLPEYDKLTHDEIIAKIKTKTVRKMRPIPAAEVKKLWGRWMVLAACWVLANTPEAPAEARVLCFATYYNLDRDLFLDLDPEDETQIEDILKYLNGLVAVGVLTEEQKQATLDLAWIDQPLEQALGFEREIDAGDLEQVEVNKNG